MGKNKNAWIIVSVGALLICALLTLGNFQYTQKNSGGNDFLVHWMGTRNFFETGTSPYSDDTALKIQTMAYGSAALPGEQELRVAYPLYSIFVFAPFALISNFTLARAFWMTFLELCLIAILFLSLRLTYWKPKLWLFAMLIIFTIISYNGIRPLINGNTAVFVTLLLVLSLILIRDGKDEIAGVLLAVSTIKPQNVILLIIFLLFWAIVNKRYRLIGYFLGSMVILVGFASVLIPDWIVQEFREILRYPSYNPPGTLGAAMISWWGAIGSRLSTGLTAILTIILAVEWWKGRNAGKKYFLWLSMLTLAVSQWIGIQTDPENFILLYPGIFFCLEMISSRWKLKANLFIVSIISVIAVGIWVLFLATMHNNSPTVQSSLLFLPLPIIAFILLYWVRWWVISSKKVDYSDRLLEI